jgi:hypothetical protein
VELTRQSMEASNRLEFEASATMFAPDAVFDASAAGLGRFEGAEAIHGYLADWYSSYEQQELRRWQGTDLGGGVVLVDVLFEARLLGSERTVRERWVFTSIWQDAMITSVVASRDIDEARAAAERLARERS